MGKTLIDANVIVALYRPDDSTHDRAVSEVTELKKGVTQLVMTNLVKQEVATVLSMRVGMELACKFLVDYKDLIDTELFVSNEDEEATWKVFSKQKKKGTSFVDCANLAVIEKYKLDGILTFDEFYPRGLVVSGS